ncbi:type ISP restriction/modification enzyme [Bradyrhizobium sp. LM2.9]
MTHLLLHKTPNLVSSEPGAAQRDVAWFLASYARDALQRVENAGNLPALTNVRSSLEEALGVTFDAEKGEHFFRSTLVQTLFYGMFSAWALWARETPRSSPSFQWRQATWHLTVPFVRTLFDQISSPAQLQPLHLVEVLDWTAATLNRVEAQEFFKRFNDADAVQFFYEPFLEAFDPELRKELGVWYTPNEVVTYMVARVDKALREDLGIEDGLASDEVFVLDPCCGTGAFLSAVLKRIEASYQAKGFGALKGQMVKKAALTRIFGFEIMPAPFVVAHLQVGLTLREMGAALDSSTERAGVFLTNALTGWEPHITKPLPFPDLEEERSRADDIKQKKRIIVVIGNPPYNGFAGVNDSREERALSEAYKKPKKVRRPEGQGLNDLYVRFFRMAERRIVQKLTVEKMDLLDDELQYNYEDGGHGIVCFVSNYSWLDGASFTAMRERYLEAYDAIRIDCLNGDKYKTGKTTPDGAPDPSVFSTEHNREGIQVGTAITTLVRKLEHQPASSVQFREIWGEKKREQLLNSADADNDIIYSRPKLYWEVDVPFRPLTVRDDYFSWLSLPDILPTSFPGVKTSRDEFLVSTERSVLEHRLQEYFSSKLSDEEIRSKYPQVMTTSDRFDPVETRAKLLKRGIAADAIVPYAYRPFDIRWLYREPETKLLDEKRTEYWPHVATSNLFLSAGERNRKEDFYQPQVTSCLCDHHLVESNVGMFPQLLMDGNDRVLNLTRSLYDFVSSQKLSPDRIFYHVVAVLQAPKYRVENAGALRMDWARVPVPRDADQLTRSADLGETLATLLNPEKPVVGISKGKSRPGINFLGLPMKQDGASLGASDLSLTAGWGYFQADNKTGNRKTMAGQGLTVSRDYTSAEIGALEAEAEIHGLTLNDLLLLVGPRTRDVYLNGDCYWSNIPDRVWDYDLGGYQVIKKWLSYREKSVLGRSLQPDEVTYVSEIVRRITAILALGPSLDASYQACSADPVTYEELGLSRDAARERRDAKTLKRGPSKKHSPATKQNRETVKANRKRKAKSG